MAWGWSHTQEAYDNLRRQIAVQDREWLEIVYAEWRCAKFDKYHEAHFRQKVYDRALIHVKKLPDGYLRKFIYEQSERQALCTNGGHLAWCCPFDCGPHELPFDRPKKRKKRDTT